MEDLKMKKGMKMVILGGLTAATTAVVTAAILNSAKKKESEKADETEQETNDNEGDIIEIVGEDGKVMKFTVDKETQEVNKEDEK